MSASSRLRVKLISASVDAFTDRAPEALVSELMACCKELDLANRAGNDVRPGVVERALEALEKWERYKDTANREGGGDGAR